MTGIFKIENSFGTIKEQLESDVTEKNFAYQEALKIKMTQSTLPVKQLIQQVFQFQMIITELFK